MTELSSSQEQAWQEWVAWLPSAPPTESPLPLFMQFRESLLSKGVSEQDAAARLALVQQLMRTRTDGWGLMFNNIYANPVPGFSTQPNALLVWAVQDRAAGRALDVGMGQGRNAVFLAGQGWDVTGFDVSSEGLNMAARHAERAGVQLSAHLTSTDKFDYGSEQWDLIVITYEPLPPVLAPFIEKLYTALRPGGILVIESFASDAGTPGRRPVDLDPADLKKALEKFAPVLFDQVVATADWGEQNVKLVRAVGEKQAYK